MDDIKPTKSQAPKRLELKTNEDVLRKLIAEYLEADYSIGLTNEGADEEQVKEREKQRFLLFKLVVADRRVTSGAMLKMIYHSLFTRYNDRTGNCKFGTEDFCKWTGLSEPTVRRTKAKIRKKLGYLVYDEEENKGGSKDDSTQYSFQFPPLSDLIGVSRAPLSGLIGKLTTEPTVEPTIQQVPLPSVADTLPCREGEVRKRPPTKKVKEVVVEGQSNGTPVSPVPFVPAAVTIEKIEDGCAWLSVRDHNAKCFALAQHDRVLARVRELRPDHVVTRVKIYVPRQVAS